MVIEFAYDSLFDNFFDLGKIANPAKLVNIALDLDNQMISMAMKVLALAIYRTTKLMGRFEIKMFSDFCPQGLLRFQLQYNHTGDKFM